jgi:hypothetical protein
MSSVLTEDEVIDAVRDRLTGQGWRVVSRASAVERGTDLVVEREYVRLEIEAKGAGSSKPHTSRFGKSFDKGQVLDHVAKAVLKALRVVSVGEARAGIALPDNPDHRAEVARVRNALRKLEVTLFWVSESGVVSEETPDDAAG